MSASDHILTANQGRFILHRLPHRARELLRAWDAADEYLLGYIAEQNFTPASRLLIVNDTFGALAVALHSYQAVALSDSYLSQQATRINLSLNQLPEQTIKLTASLEPLTNVFDCIIIKVPKTLALLEDQLIRIRPHCRPDTQIIIAGMIKALPASVWKLLERLIGSTQTSLAKKKARLIFATFDENLAIPDNPYPVTYQLEHMDYWLTNHANVFSRDHLDVGTRFFLQHLPNQNYAIDIIDLACGNGVVGLIAAERNPNARLHFVDESFMAIASAQENFYNAFAQKRDASFHVADGLNAFAAQAADLILCNPPFHQQHTIGDHIATSFFKQAKTVLKRGGELWVIGNRHLAYQQDVKRLFGNCQTVASNAKFTIWRAIA